MDESEKKKAIQLIKEMRQGDNENNVEKETLTWMYKGSSDLIDREEYLLGKAIGKSFETSKDGQNCEIISRSYEPSNVPKRLLAKSDTTEQIDIANKILEDPLYAIKKKELEARKKLLDNPVKLKELKKMIMERNSLKLQKKEEKKKRRKRKSKDHEIDEKNLNHLIIKKLNKFNVPNKIKFLKKTFKNLSSSSESEKEHVKKKNKMKRKKSKRKQSKPILSITPNSLSSADEINKNQKNKKLTRNESHERKNYISPNEKRFQERIKTHQSKDRSQENRERKHFKKHSKVENTTNYSDYSESSSESSSSSKSLSSNSESSLSSNSLSNDSTDQNNYSEKKSKTKNKSITHKRIFENSERNSQRKRRTEVSIKKSEKRNLFRDSSSNKKYIYSDKKSKSNLKNKLQSSSDSSSDERHDCRNSFKRFVRTEVSDGHKSQKKISGILDFRKQTHNDSRQAVYFSEKEMEAKLREMTENAKLRKIDRERNLANHRRKQSEEEKIKDYDEEFMKKQISLATSQGTMADRIRSNINNIQRSKADMDKSFMKK